MSASAEPAAPSEHDVRRSPLRVVYVWDADYPWDIRTEKVCSALVRGGHDVHIVARNRKWSPLREQLPEGTVHRMRPWRALGRALDTALGFPAFFSPRWSSLISGTAREVGADAIVVRDLPLCPTAIRAGRSLGIPVLLDMAENYPAMMREIRDDGRARPIDHLVRNPRAVSAVERWCIERLDRVITVVEESADRVVALGADPGRVDVVSNTPSAGRASAAVDRRRAPGAPLELVYLGLMEIHRGVGDVLEAVARLRAGGDAVRLTLIGAGRDDEIFRERARALGLGPEAVEFCGYVENREAIRRVAEADVGLVPHRASEAWNTTIPNKLFDYMAAGLPVVASNAVPVERVLRETGAGEPYRSGDVDDLVRAVRRMLDPAHRLAAGEAGRRAVRERYNWEAASETLLASLDAAVGARRGGR